MVGRDREEGKDIYIKRRHILHMCFEIFWKQILYWNIFRELQWNIKQRHDLNVSEKVISVYNG